MTISERQLATLNQAGVDAYNLELNTTLADQSRLKAVYDAEFKSASKRSQLNALCKTAMDTTKATGSAINLITDTEQHEIANADGPDKSGPLGGSLCKYVVNEKVPFGVEAASTHNLVCTSSAVTEVGIQAYLGVPLLTKDKIAIGALCVWQTNERTWSTADVMLLVMLASSAVALIS